MKKKLLIIFSVLMLSVLIVGPVAAGISGPGVSGINIQNLSTTDNANVVVQLWNQNGAGAIPISGTSGDTITKSTAKNYYLPKFTSVPDGSYAMVVSSDKPVAAQAKTEWSTSGGAAIYTSVSPGTDVTIPMILEDYASQTSQFSIQNTNTTSTISDVKITLTGRGGAGVYQKILTNQSIPAGTSKTWNMANTGVWGTLPDTALDTGATGFVGSIRIESATPLVVQSFIDVAGSRGVSAFSGVPTNASSKNLYCPLTRANYYGDTGITIVNPNNFVVNVTITFYSDAVSPNKGTFTQTIAVQPSSTNLAFQGPGGNSRQAPTNLPGGTQNTSAPNYTNNGYFGAAKLVAAEGPILATVNDVKFTSSWSVSSQTTYNCRADNDAGVKFALPLIRRYHLSTTKLTTGVSVQNITGNQIQVSMEIYNWDGTRLTNSDPTPQTIPPYGTVSFFQGDLKNLPAIPSDQGGYGWHGSAILNAGGAVVVLVNDEGFGSTKIDSGNYEGILMP